jgi:hypothetical protein
MDVKTVTNIGRATKDTSIGKFVNIQTMGCYSAMEIN